MKVSPGCISAMNTSSIPGSIGDTVAFCMAGAYAWNISHYDFLMHPKPTFHYVR